ncbi:MAG TPA: hypothetical protein VIF33_02230 [Casimicrobiaceae bacterium]|jgi:hypothetical protein
MKTIVGSFEDFDVANRVARELMDDGFRDSDVSVVASSLRGEQPGGTGTSSGMDVNARADTSIGVAGTGSMLAATGRDAVAADTTSEHYSRSVTDNALTEDGAGLTGRVRDRNGIVDDASGAAAGAVTGGVVGGAAGLAASLMGLAIPGIGPIIAAGPIVATLTGAGVGVIAGGLIGGLTDMGVSKRDAEYYAESVRRGGALVTVRADDARADRAAEIMRSHGAIDIARQAAQWRERGWTGFNEHAQPPAPDEPVRDLRNS